MSFHQPPPSTMAPPPLHVGAQGNMMPSYMPPSSTLLPGLPPPPLPPPFPGFPVPPPGQPVLQSSMMPKPDMVMQSTRPPYTRKPHENYEKKRDHQFRPNVAISDKPTVTVFVGNITEHASDALIRQLLMKCGIVVNWKRVQGADGKLQAFGFCEYIDAEVGLRAIRLLHDLSVGEKNLVVKVDAKTKAMLEEYKKNKASTMQRPANGQSDDLQNGEEELDEATLAEDTSVKKNITGLLTDNADVLSGKFAGTTSRWKASHSGNEENLEGMGMDKDKKHLISREIRFFRDAYKDSEKEKKDRGKEQEKEYEKENKERDNDRDREKDKDRDRGKERQRDRNRSQEREPERNRNDERRSRDRSRSRDRDRGGREDREKGRQNRELDEDEQYEKRKRERRLKERNQAFVERLKTWEARERKRLREYDRELEKDREQENELSREKKHLLEFLEDYDDERDDPKYYRGGSFDRRLQARMAEMESDDKDRQRELEEIEEVRKRLGEKAIVEDVSEEAKQEEPAVEVELETRPTLQATFKPAVHMVELAPKVPSPSPESPKNSPKVNIVAKAIQEENTEVDGEMTTKKTFGFEMKAKSSVGSSNPNRKKLEAVFNSEEDSLGNKGSKRKLVPLDYSEEEMKAVANSAAKTAAKTAEDKKKSIKSLIERIPTAKDELFAYSLDWECVDQSLIDRRIRPWVNKKIVEYIGEEEPSLVDFMCSKLLARSQPENILRDVSMVLDDEAEVFVVKMWRLLIYETEAKKIGLVK